MVERIALNAGGNISIQSTVDSSAYSGSGNAGDITLIAQGNISAFPNVNLTADKIAGNGNSGNINIQSGGEILFDSNQVTSQLHKTDR